MAFGIDREKFNAMVTYVRNHVGGTISVRRHKDPDNLEVMVRHYMSNYNSYPDEPILEYNNEKTVIKIKKSYEKTR